MKDWLQQIQTVAQQVEEAERKVKETQGLFLTVAKQVVEGAPSRPERIERVSHLYWSCEHVGIGVLAVAAGLSQHELRKLVADNPAQVPCDKCSAPIFARSRSDYKKLLSRGRRWFHRICETCSEKSALQWKEQQAASEKVRKDRLAELRSMPYRDYLQTPEWREQRRKTLNRARRRCQVCNSPEGTLDVHHRTYEDIGHERYNDLVVLCRSCHGTFHKTGKLVN